MEALLITHKKVATMQH